jgi:hypothetical protein
MGEACSTHERDENAYNILSGKLKGRDNSQDLGVDGRLIILERILEK